MIKKKIKKKDNIINFPTKLSSIEKEIEGIVFAAAEPLDIETIENKISKKTDVEKILLKLQAEYSACNFNKIFSTSVFLDILFSIVSISNGSAAAKTIPSISFSIEDNLVGKLIILSFFLIFFFIICFLLYKYHQKGFLVLYLDCPP